VFINIHTHLAQAHSIQNVMWGEAIPQQAYSVGIHPLHIPANIDWENFQLQASHANCLAIGECGLDTYVTTPLKIQLEIFLKQVAIANVLKKPILIHCVKAHHLLINHIQHSQSPWILHGFVNKPSLANRLLEKGFYFSFGKAIFSSIGNAQQVLKETPIHSLFLETDAASQVSIEQVYQQAALLLNCSVEFLQDNLLQNFQRIFATEFL
jgi:TatD DNase family protein